MTVSEAKQGEQSNQITTTGKLFPDGSAIDQLRGRQLVLWQQGHAHIGSTVDCGGRTYAPAIFDSNLEQVLHLPAGAEDPGCAADLIADLREALRTHVGLDQDSALLFAISSLATWVAECLPGPLLMNPWGPPGTETALLDLLGCLCRRALRLAEPALHELARLPAGLAPTVILTRPSERAFRRLFAAAGDPDTYLLSGGDVVHVHCPIIVCTQKPVPPPALSVPLLPAAMPRITKSEAQALADRFQPRLEHHRLVNHLHVANSQFDAPGFCPEARLLARVLGAALEGAPDLQADLIQALGSVDQQHKTGKSQTPAALALETLLALSHAKCLVAHVGKITDAVNGHLETRGENIQLSPRAVGEILRQDLGLSARRRPQGYELALDLNTQRRVHRLAADHNVLQPVAGCPRCEEVSVSIPTENQSVSGA